MGVPGVLGDHGPDHTPMIMLLAFLMMFLASTVLNLLVL
jgi:hypothetical protein